MRIFRQCPRGRILRTKIWGSTPAAGPPLEPAGVLSRSYGFRTAPAIELSEKVGENAHSPMFPFPNSSAPAPFNLATLRHTESLRRPVCAEEKLGPLLQKLADLTHLHGGAFSKSMPISSHMRFLGHTSIVAIKPELYCFKSSTHPFHLSRQHGTDLCHCPRNEIYTGCTQRVEQTSGCSHLCLPCQQRACGVDSDSCLLTCCASWVA